jgi:hypothetical protein
MNGNFDTDPVERVLTRHRVARPPDELRERIVRAARGRPHRHAAEWLPALAAAALIVLFYALASGIRADLAGRLPAQNELSGLEQPLVPSGDVSQ